MSGMQLDEYPERSKATATMARTATPRARPRRTHRRDLGTLVMETALALAEERGWPAVRLHDVAERLGVPPNRILERYRDLDGVADAWFRCGWEAMIAPKDPSFAEQPAKQRIETCLLAWFDVLAPHRRVTVEMLRGKMHLSHPHHWVPMIFNLSRTIHWLREAAMLPATYGTRRAQMEEVGLTGLFLVSLLVWARDDTPRQRRTRQFLRRKLNRADRLMTLLWGQGQSPAKERTNGGEVSGGR